MHRITNRGRPQARLAYRITAQADDRAEILIYDEIGEDWWGDGVSAKRFAEELSAIKAPRIDVRIKSGGGSVIEGNAIHNALVRHPATVYTYVDSIAASIASVIAMAGERIHIAANAFVMIHNPHLVMWGEARDATGLRRDADMLDTVKASLVGTYARRTGQSAERIAAWMDEETWFTAEEAVEYGFADEVTEGEEYDERIAASLAGYRDLPPPLAAMVEGAAPPEPEPEPAAEPEPEVPAAELVQLAAMVERTLYVTGV